MSNYSQLSRVRARVPPLILSYRLYPTQYTPPALFFYYFFTFCLFCLFFLNERVFTVYAVYYTVYSKPLKVHAFFVEILKMNGKKGRGCIIYCILPQMQYTVDNKMPRLTCDAVTGLFVSFSGSLRFG